MFITSHQGNANQITMKYSLIKRRETISTESEEKGPLVEHSLVGMELAQMEKLLNNKNKPEVPHDIAIPLQGIPKGNEIDLSKSYLYQYGHL